MSKVFATKWCLPHVDQRSDYDGI